MRRLRTTTDMVNEDCASLIVERTVAILTEFREIVLMRAVYNIKRSVAQ